MKTNQPTQRQTRSKSQPTKRKIISDEDLPEFAVVKYDMDQELDFFDVKFFMQKNLLRNLEQNDQNQWRFEAKFPNGWFAGKCLATTGNNHFVLSLISS